MCIIYLCIMHILHIFYVSYALIPKVNMIWLCTCVRECFCMCVLWMPRPISKGSLYIKIYIVYFSVYIYIYMYINEWEYVCTICIRNLQLRVKSKILYFTCVYPNVRFSLNKLTHQGRQRSYSASYGHTSTRSLFLTVCSSL